jgi:chromosome segregation ATPase
MPRAETTTVTLSKLQQVIFWGLIAVASAACAFVWTGVQSNQRGIGEIQSTQAVYLERMSNLERMMLDRTEDLYASTQAKADFALRDEKIAQLKASVAELRADLVEHARRDAHPVTGTRLNQLDQQIASILRQIDELKKGR